MRYSTGQIGAIHDVLTASLMRYASDNGATVQHQHLHGGQGRDSNGGRHEGPDKQYAKRD